MGDFNIDLLECKSSKISQEFFNLSSKLLSYSNRTNRSAFIELLLRWLTTSSLTILADFSLAETLFLILVIIFRSSILQLQRKIDFNKLKNIKYVTKTLCWSLSLWVVWNWLESNNCKWNRIIANGTNSVNKLFSSFYNKYNTIVDKHAPMKKLSNRKAKQLSKLWITNGIRAATKFKNKLYATGDKVR